MKMSNTLLEMKDRGVRTTEMTKNLIRDPGLFATIDFFGKIVSGEQLSGEEFLLASAEASRQASNPSEPKDIQDQDVLDAVQTVQETAEAIDSI
ncbi:hypothetical protein J4E81_005780 [Alternaria sp. BMP 2799]|nr:hypothetical protein J4E81_005780 [Alternaria sp. BMP 2799]